MKCEECLPLVEEYADGELDEKTSDLMSGHLGVCAGCALAYRKALREQELFLRYECDFQPAPEFWENVMARAAVARDDRAEPAMTRMRGLSALRARLHDLLGNFSAPRFSPSLTALMMLAAVGLTVVLMSYLNSAERQSLQAGSGQGGNAPSVSTASNAPAVSITSAKEDAPASVEEDELKVKNQPRINSGDGDGKARHVLASKREMGARALRKQPLAERSTTPADELIREAEQKYVAAINMLSRDLNRRRPQLDAETAAQFERTLSAVDRTIADTRRAARKHPNDPVAAKYVLTAYAKKVEVLREMIGY